MPDVSAIIVTYNSENEIGACLDALRGRAEVVVVDNASSDRTLIEARKRDWALVAATTENRGFAGGVNDGARLAGGDYLLLLNPDTVIQGDLDELTVACAEHGIAAGLLLDVAGNPQSGFAARRLPTPAALAFECLGWNRLWPGNPVNRNYRCLDFDFTKPGFVEQPPGAFLMIRRDIFRKLGGFDERFWPVWFEDVDFCKRAADAGYQIAYTPSVRAVHAGGHSVSRIPLGCQRIYWYGSLLKYAGKHFGSVAFRTLCAAVIAGSLVKLITGTRDRRNSVPLGVWWRVIRLAGMNLLTGNRLPREEKESVQENQAFLRS